MSSSAQGNQVPHYDRHFDAKKFYRDYPPPELFAETIFRWPRDKVRSLQEERFKEMIALGW